MARKKNPAAVALGRLGGKARAKSTTPERLSEIGRLGVKARIRKNQLKKGLQVS